MKTTQRILVVDDEEAILFSYRKLLRGRCVEVDVCMTLEDAISLINKIDYDAIITDLRLSHSESNEGIEILEYVRRNGSETAVIFMTGYGNEDIKSKVMALGAWSYFDKPVQLKEIINDLNALGIRSGES